MGGRQELLLCQKRRVLGDLGARPAASWDHLPRTSQGREMGREGRVGARWIFLLCLVF